MYRRGGFLASAVEQFLKLDLTKWLKVLRDLDLLPKIMDQDWSYIWLQKFDGSVTILVSIKCIEPPRAKKKAILRTEYF